MIKSLSVAIRTFFFIALWSLFLGAGSTPVALAAFTDCSDMSVTCPAGEYCDLVDFVCRPVAAGGGGGTGGGLNLEALGGYKTSILELINNIIFPILFAIAFITFMYGVVKKYILSQGDAGAVEEGHKLILWGIIGFVVMISLWGLVNLVSSLFDLSGGVAPGLPTTPL